MHAIRCLSVVVLSGETAQATPQASAVRQALCSVRLVLPSARLGGQPPSDLGWPRQKHLIGGRASTPLSA